MELEEWICNEWAGSMILQEPKRACREPAPPEPAPPEVTSFFRPGELTAENCQQELLQALRDKRCANNAVDRLEEWLSRGDGGLWGSLLNAIADVNAAEHRIWLWSRKLRKVREAK